VKTLPLMGCRKRESGSDRAAVVTSQAVSQVCENAGHFGSTRKGIERVTRMKVSRAQPEMIKD